MNWSVIKCENSIDVRNKRLIFISYIIFTFSFLFSRLPFLIWFPIPGYTGDSFDYFNVVYKLYNGCFSSFGILPPGYILFSYFSSLLSDQIIVLIWLQLFISFCAGFYLLFVINKFYPQVSIFVSIILSFYLLDGEIMNIETHIGPDSIYKSFLMFLSALLIALFNKNKQIYFLLISIALVCIGLTRSNGLFIYFIPFLLVFFSLIKYKWNLKLFIVTFLFLNLIWASFNFFNDNEFNIGTPKRQYSIYSTRETVLKRQFKVDVKLHRDWASFANYKMSLLNNFSHNISTQKPHFYYTHIYDRFDMYYQRDLIRKGYLLNEKGDTMWATMNDIYDRIPLELKRFTYREYYEMPRKLKNTNELLKSSNGIKGAWLKLFSFYYFLHSIIVSSVFWFYWFLIIFLFSGYLIYSERMSNKLAVLIFSISLIHIFNLITLTLFGWFQGRYIQVTEFIVYLVVALSPLIINYKALFYKLKQRITFHAKR